MLSRSLFLINRYFPPLVTIIALYCFFAVNLTSQVCTAAIKGCFMLNVVGLSAVQAVLVVRIWFLFQHSLFIRIVAVLTFVVAALLSAVFVGQSFPLLMSQPLNIPGIPQVGCSIPPPQSLWRLFLPALILHTFLFILTALRAFRTPKVFRDAPLMRRLLRDGGVFYFVVVVIVGFCAIGAFLVDSPAVNITAIYSNIMLTVTSVAISRLMLNIRSLADRLGYDEQWIFNNVEISRLNWRKGPREGEIIVEVHEHPECDVTTVDTPRSQHEEFIECGTISSSTDGCSKHCDRWSDSGVRITRVGELPHDHEHGGITPVRRW
ncbi:hypothetical protein L218DRAFT_1076341 [Marasmius fiardii PR-910]|nr:hypothetical protein L218DRAFT_1076341 [Marasmius fiardii PR-910]